MPQTYNFTSIQDIDNDTLDYLEYIAPRPLNEMSIVEINQFLTRAEQCFFELRKTEEVVIYV